MDTSEYGYWIDPVGKIHPLLAPQSHYALGRSLIGKTVLDDVALHAWMIDQGWTAINFDPTGTQMSVRCREIGLDRRAVSGIVRVVSTHEWRPKPVYTEFSTEPFTGQTLYLHLRDRSRDAGQFADPIDEIASLKVRLEETEARNRVLEATVRSIGEQSGIDFKSFNEHCRGIEVSAEMSQRDIKKFFDVTKTMTTAKEVLDLAHYYFGHELERRMWYIKHLEKKLRGTLGAAK